LNPIYSGPEPQFVELVDHEDNRRATGTVTVRFKLPQGSFLDTALHGDFTGTFENTAIRSSVFKPMTAPQDTPSSFKVWTRWTSMLASSSHMESVGEF
jgi:hypothetical protein